MICNIDKWNIDRCVLALVVAQLLDSYNTKKKVKKKKKYKNIMKMNRNFWSWLFLINISIFQPAASTHTFTLYNIYSIADISYYGTYQGILATMWPYCIHKQITEKKNEMSTLILLVIINFCVHFLVYTPNIFLSLVGVNKWAIERQIMKAPVYSK